MGMANSVRQGLSFSLPGFHRGITLTTRIASRSSSGCTDCSILGEDMLPSRLMINDTTTLPCMPPRWASAG